MAEFDDLYNLLKNVGSPVTGTGSHEKFDNYKIITYPVGKYEIKVKLSLTNEFIGVVEVKVNQSFLSYKEKVTPKGYHDVEEFYRE